MLKKSNFKNIVFIIVLAVILLFAILYINDYLKPNKRQFKLSKDEIEWISKHPVIRVTGDPFYKPFDFYNKNGEHDGLSADYLKLISEMTGIRFKYVKAKNWTHVLELAANKEIDIISNIAQTESRLSFLNFTESFEGFPFYIITNTQQKKIIDFESLKGKKIGLPKDYAWTRNFEENQKNLIIIQTKSDFQSLEDVNTQRLDATICDLASVSYYVKNEGLSNLKVVDEINMFYHMRFGILKEQTQLLHIMNKALNHIDTGEKERIYNEWVQIQFEKFNLYKTLAIYISLILLIMAVVLIFYMGWNKLLKIRVFERTKELNEIKDNLDLKIDQKTTELNNTVQLLEKSIEEKNQLFSIISHDLKNAFSGLIGVSELILEEEHMEVAEQRYLLETIRNSSKDTYHLLMNLLEWSSSRFNCLPIRKEKIAIADVVKEVLAFLNLQIESKNINLESINTEIHVVTDQRRLETILRNILSNSVKYTEKNGRISISCKSEERLFSIEIKDSGVGISEEKIKELFENNNSMSERGTQGEKGTGIGFVICRQFVKDLDGEIKIESELEKGSQFTLIFPQ